MKRNKIRIKEKPCVCVCLGEYIAMVMGAGEHSPGQKEYCQQDDAKALLFNNSLFKYSSHCKQIIMYKPTL